ncbi:eae-like domain protein [Escherichia coli]|nr:eae-like domain protein [Escherichia coli]
MESNIKGLVTAGHEMASELKAECGAVDMRSVAKLISDLATQLEVQLVRANALSEDQQKAIESIKQADAAVKLAHEKFSELAAENAGLKAICDDRRRFIMNGVQMGYIKVPAAETDPDLETIRIAISPQKPIPATDAFLSEVRAQGVDAAIEAAKNLVVQEYEYKDFKAAQSDCCMHPGSDLVGEVEMTEWLVDFAAQLRKGGNQ